MLRERVTVNRYTTLPVHMGLTVKTREYEDQPWSGIRSLTVWDKLTTVSEEFSASIFRTEGKATRF